MGDDATNLLGIVPPSGQYGNDWPAYSVLTQGINGGMSDAGWKEGSEGFPQQTFLGASIRSFSMNAGFGDSTSTLSVELVNDEYNVSDGTLLGSGDDPYHNGDSDQFLPPVVGTPVYFKFGTNPASVEQAYRKTFDDTYKTDTLDSPTDFVEVQTQGEITQIPNKYHYLRSTEGKGTEQVNTWIDKSPLYNPETKWRGKDHLVFGGILQSYTQNESTNGKPLYSLQVTDPREILSNVQVLLSNYAGTTFNNKNLLNVFGFLEHDPTEPLKNAIEMQALSKNVVRKIVNPVDGSFEYFGDDNYHFAPAAYSQSFFDSKTNEHFKDTIGNTFPITGQGFARRSERGMPWYRIRDGLNALMGNGGFLPTEYEQAGYGGAIDFRGYKYVVDFGGIPTDLIPNGFFLDFDKLDLLSLAQELCDIISHELFVSLLPVIDHPSCKVIYDFNQDLASRSDQDKSQMIVGIIRIDAIDKRKPPKYGAIKSYLDYISKKGIEVENKDVGYELSNVTTDKFVVGAQEVNMHYFTTNKDRNDIEVRKKKDGQNNRLSLLERDKWDLNTMLKQQVIPFYGFLGSDKAVTIPKGFGSYQQILLDATGLNAFGVGNYYVATEIELRASLVSFRQWKNFLLQYDEQWMKKLVGPIKLFNQNVPADVKAQIDELGFGSELTEMLKVAYDGVYGVSVPRCVWRSDKNYLGRDGYPASPCSPPFGYPLYYKRAEKIGITEGGIVSVLNATTTLMSNLSRLKDKVDTNEPYFNVLRDDALDEIKKIEQSINRKWLLFKKGQADPSKAKIQFAASNVLLYAALAEARALVEKIEEDLKNVQNNDKVEIGIINDVLNNNQKLIKNSSRLAKEGEENAKKVYNFVKKVAEENLGKKFLVKIPKKANVNFTDKVSYFDDNANVKSIRTGPFGFRPLPTTASQNYYLSGLGWSQTIAGLSSDVTMRHPFEHYLDHDLTYNDTNFRYGYSNGALKCNYNPFSDNWEYNYKPEPQGGYVDHTLRGFTHAGSRQGADSRFKSAFPNDIMDTLSPIDPTNMMAGDNRMSCYVRFDNSHFYDFSKISSDSLSQQSINSYGFVVPDVLEDLDNVDPDQSLSFAEVQNRRAEDKLLGRQDPSVAFVKCDIDESFYMPPVMQTVPTKVFARGFKIVVPVPKVEIINVNPDDDPATDEDESKCLIPSGVIRKVIPMFSPANGRSRTVNTSDFARSNAVDGAPVYSKDMDIVAIDSDVVQLVAGHKTNQDPNHVYALVTLPGMITSTVDLRYCDGPRSAYQTARMYNIQTRDVVKGVRGFEQPAEFTNGSEIPTCENLQEFTVGEINQARAAQKQAVKSAAVSSMDGRLSFISPSPVYPDMVAIPLMSMERCYGPWLSNASLDPQTLSPGVTNIGGKMEFVKDENLAPWNFGGYKLMNDAGYLQAQFSNSLLLFTERGGFVIPQVPTGVSIAKSLQDGGPLVTSINVGISDNKVNTTIKMDLYTSSFGKLQKQKEGNIAQITREKQKLTDQRNNAIRRGMGKTLSNKNFYESVIRGGGQALINAAQASSQHFTDFEKGKMEHNNIVVSAKTSWENGVPLNLDGTVDQAENLSALVKTGTNFVQTSVEGLQNIFGMNQDSVDESKTQQNITSAPISNFLELLDEEIAEVRVKYQLDQRSTPQE